MLVPGFFLQKTEVTPVKYILCFPPGPIAAQPAEPEVTG